MLQPLESYWLVMLSFPDELPSAAVIPIIGGLTAAVTFQTARIVKMSNRTEEMLSDILDEVLDRRRTPQRRRKASGDNPRAD